MLNELIYIFCSSTYISYKYIIRIFLMSSNTAYFLSDLTNLRVKVDIKRLIDQNNVLKNQTGASNSINQIFCVFDLISHNARYSPQKYSKIYKQKLQLNQSILFDWNYQNLSNDSRIAITIWSSSKKLQDKKPLGSTVISIFDENDCLRQGKYHLFVWPDVLPDFQWPTSTPGLTDDPNIQTLNFVAERKQNMIRKNVHDQRVQQALNIKLYYTYRLIPAAFLEIQFPKFQYPVLFQDKLSINEQPLAKYLTTITEGNFNDCFQIYDPDYEAGRADPLEETFYFLKRQNQVNPDKLVPKKEELKIIDATLSRSFRADNIKAQEKQLFVKYRYYLSTDKRYLIHYLHSVQWGTHEEAQALKLIQIWDKIDWPDALHILTKQFAANSLFNKKKSQAHNTMKQIRDYATEIISGLSEEIFTSILLQLIQTIRYDMIGDNNSSMSRLIIQKSLKIEQIAVLVYWYLKTQSQIVKESKSSKQQISQDIKIYIEFFKTFQDQIKKNQKIWYIITQQEKLISYLRDLSRVIKAVKNDREAEYRKRLFQTNWQQFGPVAYPLDLSIVFKCPIIAECSIFSSAMAPFRLTFELVNGGKYGFIYKNGDDLRQDQLILCLFALMDKILKGVNQDYKLTPYQALACSRSDGFVQFVPKTKTFQSVSLKDHLQNLIKKKSEAVMENYIFSTAGYCAITYFFMIGDRHLQNLLIDQEGKIFHIDFGFILGRDPKPYPPPIKVSKQMIDAMGSNEKQQQENFKKFKLKCLEAYLYLRKQSKMVYNLTALMLDSGIKDVHNEGLSKLFDKFSINLNDEQAQKYFLLVLEECKNALFPSIADKIHIWATYFRK